MSKKKIVNKKAKGKIMKNKNEATEESKPTKSKIKVECCVCECEMTYFGTAKVYDKCTKCRKVI